MRSLVVIDVVGLVPRFVGPATPNLDRFAQRGGLRPLATVLPAVTCSAQSTFLTGLPPSGHGSVGNGWYFRDLGEVFFWRQSARLVNGERLWEAARKHDPQVTCANLFWWYAMHTTAEISVTPRPIYCADGRKIPDCWAQPPGLREELTERLGRFPLFSFWGPTTSIASSRWITDAALHIRHSRKPTLTLVYLPHLDYGLQRLGPEHPSIAADLAAVDALCGELIEDAERDGGRVVVLSEYGITAVSTPIHPNRALRQAGLLSVRDELGREQLDLAASAAFAVADHQLAHVYVQRPERLADVRAVLQALPGVECVLEGDEKRAAGLDHPRSGELVTVARPDAWFTYYFWLDDARAPDYARTVDIHRKPGYDPVELFLDPALRFPKLAVGTRLAARKLGFRTPLDVIPLDATLVKGSHGRLIDDPAAGPLIIGSAPELMPRGTVSAVAVRDLLLRYLFEEKP